MLTSLRRIWSIVELRNSILFVIAMLVVFRITAHIPIPGVDVAGLRQFFASNQVLGLLNLFSGGTLQNFSVVLLGVGPYITASIILQLLGMVIPRLEELQKEGEQGQRIINQYTRILTVPLAILQGFGTLSLIRKSPIRILGDLSLFQMIVILITMTAGTLFLMWLGELISERKIGNGISLLIFAGIVSRLPSAVQQMLVTFDRSQIVEVATIAALALVTVVGVVIVTEGQRNIPVQYARQVRGIRLFGGASSHLPLRVNMAGVIPIIFAISVVLFPPMIAQFFTTARTAAVAHAALWVIRVFNNQTIYGVLYFLLVVGFTYFYTAIVFQPEKVAENLQKQGGFVPGIRPGVATVEYLRGVVARILPAGALFLGAIAVLPVFLRQTTGSQNLLIGGTSLLIVVSVAIEIMKQIEAQLTMREYENI